MTSLLSKAGTAVLRLVSIPIAIRVLGMEEFGLYMAITLAIYLVDALHVGIGPALTHGISSSIARKDRRGERLYFSNGFLLSLALTLVAVTCMVVALLNVPITTMFGEKYAGFESMMMPALWLGLVIIGVETLCAQADRAREGYLEANINNIWGAAGNFLGALLLGVGVFYFPTIFFIVIAVNGSLLFAKLGNMIHLFVQRPYLWPSPKLIKVRLLKELSVDGVAFSVAYILSALVEFNVVAMFVSHIGGPAKVATYGVLITLHISLMGFVAMITVPLWPAVVDSYARRDFRWIQGSVRKLYLYAMTYAAGVLLVILCIGPTLFRLWLGTGFDAPHSVLVAFGLYFLINTWRHVNQVLLFGVGKVKQAAGYTLLECGVMLIGAYLAMRHFGLTGVFLTMATIIACLNGWRFPLAFFRELRRAQAEDGEAGGEEPKKPPKEDAPVPTALPAVAEL